MGEILEESHSFVPQGPLLGPHGHLNRQCDRPAGVPPPMNSPQLREGVAQATPYFPDPSPGLRVTPKLRVPIEDLADGGTADADEVCNSLLVNPGTYGWRGICRHVGKIT